MLLMDLASLCLLPKEYLGPSRIVDLSYAAGPGNEFTRSCSIRLDMLKAGPLYKSAAESYYPGPGTSLL